jgi:hypothetical protein
MSAQWEQIAEVIRRNPKLVRAIACLVPDPQSGVPVVMPNLSVMALNGGGSNICAMRSAGEDGLDKFELAGVSHNSALENNVFSTGFHMGVVFIDADVAEGNDDIDDTDAILRCKKHGLHPLSAQNAPRIISAGLIPALGASTQKRDFALDNLKPFASRLTKVRHNEGKVEFSGIHETPNKGSLLRELRILPPKIEL